MPGPTFLDGETVTLRPVEASDVEFLQGLLNDPAVRRGLDQSRPINEAQETDFFESVICADGTVQLLLTAGDESVGLVSFDMLETDLRIAELGVFVAPDHQQQGYGTEATELFVGYGFDELGLEKIVARVFAFNDTSARLLERVGFTREGVLRKEAFVDGARQDVHRYGVLATEWE